MADFPVLLRQTLGAASLAAGLLLGPVTAAAEPDGLFNGEAVTPLLGFGNYERDTGRSAPEVNRAPTPGPRTGGGLSVSIIGSASFGLTWGSSDNDKPDPPTPR